MRRDQAVDPKDGDYMAPLNEDQAEAGAEGVAE